MDINWSLGYSNFGFFWLDFKVIWEKEREYQHKVVVNQNLTFFLKKTLRIGLKLTEVNRKLTAFDLN